MIFIFYFFFLLNSVSSFFKQSDLKNTFFSREVKENLKLYDSNKNYYLLTKKVSVYNTGLEKEYSYEPKDSRSIYFHYKFNEKEKITVYKVSDTHFFIDKTGNYSFKGDINLLDTPIQDNLYFYHFDQYDNFDFLFYYVTKNKPHKRYVHAVHATYLNYLVSFFEWNETAGQNDYFRNYPTRLLQFRNLIKFIVFYNVFTFQEETLYLKDKMFPGSNNKDIHFLPFLTFFSTLPESSTSSMINFIYEMPLICRDNAEEDGWGFKIYKDLEDITLANGTKVPSIFFLADNQYDQALCFFDRYEFRAIYEDYQENINKLNCVDSKNFKFCQYKNIEIFAKPIIKFEKKTYKRVFVKTLNYEDKVTYIIFLLDHSNRFIVYDFIYNIETKSFETCFEGVYNLINKDTIDILGIIFDELNDQFIITTSFYMQKISLSLFCTDYSKSSCNFGESTCSIGNKLSNICESKKTKCTYPDSNLKSTSNLFYCDYEYKEMCLVPPTNQTAISKYKNLICKKPFCLCKNIACLPHKCVGSNKKEICFLKKSEMTLSSYIDIYNIEPISYLFYSIIVSFLTLAFVLISFYCCFSNSQVSKVDAQNSEISKVDLSKFDVKKSHKKRYK